MVGKLSDRPSRMQRRTPSVSGRIAAATAASTGGKSGSCDGEKSRVLSKEKMSKERLSKEKLSKEKMPMSDRRKNNKAKGTEAPKKANTKREGNLPEKKKAPAASAVGKKPSREDLKQPPSKNPSKEQVTPGLPKKPSKEQVTAPVPKKPSKERISPAPPKKYEAKQENLKRMDRFKKKIDEKEKKKDEKVKTPKKIKPGDEAFPKAPKAVEDAKKEVDAGLQPSAKITGKSYLERAKAKAKNSNNNNGGKLFIMDPVAEKERPFWIQEELYRPPLSEDDFILDSGTTNEFLSGKMQLAAEAPDWTKVFDPMEKLSKLQEKDDAAFKNLIIFRNSVRSMIDVIEPASPDGMTEEKSDYEPQEMNFILPQMVNVYNPKKPAEIAQVPFQPGQN